MNDYGVKYEFDGSSYYVSDNRTLNQKEVVILDTYTDGIHGEHPVTFVKNSAFAGNTVLRKITLPKSVIRLDGSVFENCGNLEYVSMTGITDMAFVGLPDEGIYQGIQGLNTGNNFLDCYKLDGTRLWRINLGKNIRAGAHYTQFMVYDLDGDGRAEMVAKTVAVLRLSGGSTVKNICVHPATDLAVRSGANVVVIETGAIPRDNELAQAKWRHFDCAKAKQLFQSEGYTIG